MARFCTAFPRQLWGREMAIKLAGAGGDGTQTAGLIVARAAVNEGLDATCIPCYGPQSRGGTSYADVRIDATEILSPAVPAPDALVAFNAPSLAAFGNTVVAGGIIIYDRSVTPDPPRFEQARVIPVPMSTIAHDLGEPRVKNLIALGALTAAGRLFPDETMLVSMRQTLEDKQGLHECNERAFAAGARFARGVLRPAHEARVEN